MRSRPFPKQWEEILERRAPYYRLLPDAEKSELRERVLVFLNEKRFEGCGGLVMTDEIRLIVAAYACILLLHRDTDYYPQLESVLIYPDVYVAPSQRHVGEYIVEEGEDVREGESWYRGALILSWKDVRRGIRNASDGENVVFHEFAHQLDDESGAADGTPVLEDRSQWSEWVRVFQQEYLALQDAVDRGARTLLDPYGIESPSEFFAVVTECFFERPGDLLRRHPALYAQLRSYYRQNPVEYFSR